MRGRPTKFTDALREKILALYEAGKTDAQVAKIIGVSRRTITNWKGADSEFLLTVKESKSVADDLVEASLFSRATGYSHAEEKIFVYEGHIIRAPTVKHYPPDVTAGIFWLCNRQPDRWKRGAAGIYPEATNMTQPVAAIGAGKKTFAEFCATAGYPAPFEKQIEMMTFGMLDGDPRLLLGARGYGKTDYVTVLGVAYDIYLHGTASTNLIITKSKTRNTAIIQEIAEALKKNGVTLEKENSSCLRVAGLIGKDHSVEVLTIKSSFRGRHPKRIIMDDPVTEEDTSEAMRTLVKKKYDEAYKLAKNIVIIGQPAHAFDLYATLRPSLHKMEVPYGQIPELDADLEAMKIAGVDANSIEMSYHLRVPVSGTIPFANIQYIDKLPDGDAIAFIDPSDGGDFTAVSILKGYFQGIAVEGQAWQRPWYHCDELVPFLLANNVKKVRFETNATGSQPIVQLRSLLAPHGVEVVGVHSDTNKHATIMQAGSFASMIHLSRNSSPVYTKQVTQYEHNAKFDDAPDSLARGMVWLGLIKGKK